MVSKDGSLVWKMTFGVFGILTTELGVIGVLPLIAKAFHVTVSQAGWLVSAFAFGVALAGPFMPMLFSGVNRKKSMLLVQGIFVVSNVVAMLTSSFTVLLLTRLIPALFHPIYCSAAFTVAANSVDEKDAPKAVSKVMMGVSAGMVFGVPVTSFIASTASLKFAMLFFAIVNGVAFVVTLLSVPSLPVGVRLSYGAQLGSLKKGLTWISLSAVALIAASMSSVYSYVADYLQDVTNVSPQTLSLILMLFGVASIYGNPVAGKVLSKNATKSVLLYPFALGGMYVALLLLGKFALLMFPLVCVWGVLYGAGNNFQQYWIASALPEAPEFANGLFLSFGNLGITIGTTVGGLLIAGGGVQAIIAGGLLLLSLTFISVLLRGLLFGKSSRATCNETA